MEFNKAKKVRHQASLSEHELEYSTRLRFYKYPPVQSLSLEEFEDLALTRLKLLQEVEKHRGTNSGDVWNRVLKTLPLKAEDERRRDHVSHYILRLAYCRNEEMRRWFLNQETELLKQRFLAAILPDKKAFFQLYKDEFCFESVTVSVPNEQSPVLPLELQEFYQLRKSLGAEIECSFQGYKIPFSSALDLVRTRQVVVKQGFVYIPESNQELVVSMVCNKFRARLSEELVKTNHHMSVVDDDERIAPMLKKLEYRYLGEDFSNTSSQQEAFNLSNINKVARESFPPCMRHLHETLRKEHHLKHFARLQYGLFLKSIGLTLKQALKLWRTEFVKKMEPDKFEKQYAYNIRHSYGKEGKRANYTAYSCIKIIMGNSPGQGDSHGCPFKHWDEEHVRKMLTSHGLPHKGVRQVTEYLREHHYQVACQKYFEIVHGVTSAPFSLEHPSQFYLESRKLRGGGGIKQGQVEAPQQEFEGQVEAPQQEFEDLDMDVV